MIHQGQSGLTDTNLGEVRSTQATAGLQLTMVQKTLEGQGLGKGFETPSSQLSVSQRVQRLGLIRALWTTRGTIKLF